MRTFSAPSIEVECFNVEDVITASTWTPDNDETER